MLENLLKYPGLSALYIIRVLAKLWIDATTEEDSKW